MKWNEDDHPRDGEGRFTDGPGWLQSITDALSPEIAELGPKPDELPMEADTLAEFLRKLGTAKYSLSNYRTKQGKLWSYLARATTFSDIDRSGVRARLNVDHGVNINSDHSIELIFDLVNEDGDSIGRAERVLRLNSDGQSMSIEHRYFKIKRKSWRGGGFASRWNAHMEDFYRANGGSEIRLEANLEVGGYAWAKQGYGFVGHQSMEKVANRFREAYEVSPGLQARTEVEALLARSTREHWDAGTAPTPLEWAMVGWTEGADSWPGKFFMLDATWNGVKKL